MNTTSFYIAKKDTAKAQGELFEQEVVRDAFSSCEEAITEQQLSICKKYWGFDYVKSKEEMRLILDMCSKAYAVLLAPGRADYEQNSKSTRMRK